MTNCIWRFPSAMHSGTAGGYKCPELFLTCNSCDHDNSASLGRSYKEPCIWYCQPELCHVLMSLDRSRYFGNIGHTYSCPVVMSYSCHGESPRWQDSDDRIGHVLIVIYCSWPAASTTSKEFGHLQWPVGPLCITCGNLQIRIVIVPKLFDWKRWLIHQNGADKYHMTRSPRRLNSAQYDKNCKNWPKVTFKWPAMAIFFPNFEKLMVYSKSKYQTATEKI